MCVGRACISTVIAVSSVGFSLQIDDCMAPADFEPCPWRVEAYVSHCYRTLLYDHSALADACSSSRRKRRRWWPATLLLGSFQNSSSNLVCPWICEILILCTFSFSVNKKKQNNRLEILSICLQKTASSLQLHTVVTILWLFSILQQDLLHFRADAKMLMMARVLCCWLTTTRAMLVYHQRQQRQRRLHRQYVAPTCHLEQLNCEVIACFWMWLENECGC